MKKYLLILLFSNAVFSQKIQLPETFTVVNNKIIWTKIYDSNNSDIIKNLKSDLSLKIDSDSTGTANHLNLRCKGISIYCMSNFSINFKVESKGNQYRILVSDIIFEQNIQFETLGVRTSETTSTIESFELRNKDNTLRQNSQSAKNLKCINDYLINLFTVKEIEKW